MKVHSSEEEGTGTGITTNGKSTCRRRKGGGFMKVLDDCLVGKNDPADFSKAWRKKFSKHPSWCDADMCLQQINAENATGNRVALYSRALFQKLLFHLGEFVQEWPKSILVVGIVVLFILCLGLKDVHIETDLVRLWVEQGGRLDEEMNFLPNAKLDFQRRGKRNADEAQQPIVAKQSRKESLVEQIVEQSIVEMPTENTFGGGFQVVIQTPEVAGENILTREGLLRHVTILEQVSQYSVELFGEKWYLSDICFKPPPPASNKDVLAQIMEDIVAQIIPCVWITPIDCFWEGSKPLGPFPPLDLGPVAQFVPSVPNGQLTWRTLNPEALLKSAGSLIDVGMVADLFDRAGIGAAYQDRPCIDPLDPECPSSAPNAFNRCAAYHRFAQWNAEQPEEYRVVLQPESGGRKGKRQVGNDGIGEEEAEHDDESTTTNSTGRATTTTTKATPVKASVGAADPEALDYYDDNEEGGTTTTESPAQKASRQQREECERYGRAFIEWLRNNRERVHEFIGTDEHALLPAYPDYGRTMTGGCRGFGKNIMNWPEDLIVGGIRRDAQNFHIQQAEAFQTVFLVASANDVYQRLKRSKNRRLEGRLARTFTPGHAGAIVAAWQRNFTKHIYEHALNRPSSGIRVVHPLASTSIQDMLSEFSEFQFAVIFIGYVLMIIYAGWSQLQWDGWWFGTKSSCLLAIVGVLVITLASVAGLGLATAMGIHFNAATTQIVPFLTLGLGIDDMFLLLHNYNDVLEAVRQKEVAVLLKETGMSVLITSINNILAFLTGCMLPIPALRSFCGQVAILLTSNVICIILIFPAFIALDLKRRKAGYRDMTLGYFCCGYAKTQNNNNNNGAEMNSDGSEKPKMAMDESEPVSNNNSNKTKKKRKLEECSSRNQLVKTDSAVSTTSEIDMQQMSAAVFGGQPQLRIGANGKKTTIHQAKRKNDQHKWYTLSGFLYGYYIPLLRQPVTKASVLLLCAAMFLFGCFGLYHSRIGLELADVLPEDTAPAAFLQARERYFSFYPMFIVPKGPWVDYAVKQDKLERLRKDIAGSDFVIKVNGQPEQWWMMFMRTWLHSLQATVDRAVAAGIRPTEELKTLNENALAHNFTLTDDFYLARKLLCSVGHTFNCTQSIGIRLIDEHDHINTEGFYNYLTAWFYQDNMMYYVSQAAFFPAPPAWHFVSTEERAIPPADPLLYSQMPFYMKGLTDTPAIVQMIKEIRSICDRYSADGLPVYPSGIPFTFWEQYLKLTFYLMSAILIIGVAVLLVISLIIFNPWAAAMVAIIVVTMTVELAGFMGVFGVKMNPISAVTLITAVGIGVEFTAHVVLAFLTSLGTRDERMVSCLEHMFIPVIHGGLSTLLGIVMLAFSEFDFVIKYFFVVMTALVIIGLINGLALLPVLLSLIGPPCEITPVDGTNLLPCPASSRYRPEDSPCFFLPSVRQSDEHQQQNTMKKTAEDCSASSSSSSSSTTSSSDDPGNTGAEEAKTEQQQQKKHEFHESLSTLYEASGEERERSTPSAKARPASVATDTIQRF